MTYALARISTAGWLIGIAIILVGIWRLRKAGDGFNRRDLCSVVFVLSGMVIAFISYNQWINKVVDAKTKEAEITVYGEGDSSQHFVNVSYRFNRDGSLVIYEENGTQTVYVHPVKLTINTKIKEQ
jgi:hypothetical protein